MTEFYTDAVKELRNIYDNLNKDYYDNELPEIVITIQSSPKGRAYGWYGAKFWGNANNKDDTFDEINISAEYLSRPIYDIISTLQHEMVHLYCDINDIKDTSNNHVYHNKKFKLEAEKRGLSITKAQTIGYSVTKPSEKFIEYIDKLNINENIFKFFRKSPFIIDTNGSSVNDNENDDNDDNDATEKKRTTKYTCPVCGVSVRGEVGLEIECKKCNALMQSKH